MDLFRVTAEYDSGRMLFDEPKQLRHLTPGHHAGFVEDQDLRAARCLGPSVLQEPLDSDCVRKAHLLQLLDCAHSRSNSKHFMSGLNESTPQLLESRRFAGSRGATYVHGPVARVEHELDNSFLLRYQTIGDYQQAASAQTLKAAYAAIDASDHFPLTLEAGRCRDFIPIPQNCP